jgi:hypothetical protein
MKCEELLGLVMKCQAGTDWMYMCSSEDETKNSVKVLFIPFETVRCLHAYEWADIKRHGLLSSQQNDVYAYMIIVFKNFLTVATRKVRTLRVLLPLPKNNLEIRNQGGVRDKSIIYS